MRKIQWARQPEDREELPIIHFGWRQNQQKEVCYDGGQTSYVLRVFHTTINISTTPTSSIKTTTPTIIMCQPEKYLKFSSEPEGGMHSWIHFSEDINPSHINNLLKKTQLPIHTPIPLSTSKILEQTEELWENIHDATHNHHVTSQILLESLLQLHLARIKLHSEQMKKNVNIMVPNEFIELKQYIEHHHLKTMSLNELAKKAHLSTAHCSQKFKSYFGISPIDYQLKLRLQHAKNLLQDNNLSISKIAHQVGYHDVFTFSKLFKRHVGTSPSHFRKSLGHH